MGVAVFVGTLMELCEKNHFLVQFGLHLLNVKKFTQLLSEIENRFQCFLTFLKIKEM